MSDPLRIAFDFIDQDLNPACFYNRKTRKIEYTNKILDQMSLDRDFLLQEINDYEDNFKQGMQVELFGKKYNAYVFNFVYGDIIGSIITIRLAMPMTLDRYHNAFFKSNVDPMMLIDRQGHIYATNSKFDDEFDFNETPALNIQDVLSSSKKNQHSSEMMHQLLQGITHIKETVYMYDKQKKLVPVLMNVVPLYDHDVFVGAFIHFKNMTENMRLEVTMDAFKKIIEHMSDAILITDKSFNLVYANQAYKNLIFLDTNEFKSGKFQLFDESKHPDKYIKGIWRQVEKTQEWRGETWILRSDGSHKMVWLQLFSIFDEHQSVDLYVASYKNYSKAIPDSDELLHLLSRDVLTNLYNRYYFLEHVAKELASHPDQQQFIGFIDMDSFKQVNDTYGHMYGDMILAQIATNLKEIFLGHVVARYGGDEFVVYFSLGTTIEQIKNYQDIFEIKITSFLKQILDNMNVSASIGVAEYPKDGTTVQELVSNADLRMYVDKKE